jgi:hypothetical protein
MSFNDPEGPNLLIVLAMGAGICLASLWAVSFSSLQGFKKLLLVILVQVLLLIGLYFCLR